MCVCVCVCVCVYVCFMLTQNTEAHSSYVCVTSLAEPFSPAGVSAMYFNLVFVLCLLCRLLYRCLFSWDIYFVDEELGCNSHSV